MGNNKLFFFYENPIMEIRPNSLEAAYLAVLNENLDIAKSIFDKIDSPRAIWGSILVGILEGYIKIYPTYFQIRNFLEIDLDLLLKNEKIPYVEQLIGSAKILTTVNAEIYKYIARTMYVNKLYAAAYKYMVKSKKIYYNDAELHFMLTKYFLHIKDYEQALFYVNECLKLIPDYYPALILKEEIDENFV